MPAVRAHCKCDNEVNIITQFQEQKQAMLAVMILALGSIDNKHKRCHSSQHCVPYVSENHIEALITNISCKIKQT